MLNRDWMKSSVTYTFVGEGYEKGVKRSFANLTRNVSAEQVVGFAGVLKELTGERIIDATVTTTDHVGVE